MFKFKILCYFAIFCVVSQSTANNEECTNQRTYQNYYYIADANSVASSLKESLGIVLNKTLENSQAGGSNKQEENPCADFENATLELLQCELDELASRFQATNEKLQMELSLTKMQLSILQSQCNNAENLNNKSIEALKNQLLHTNDELSLVENTLIPKTTDCSHNVPVSGVYYIKSNQKFKPIYCEVENDGKTWLVFQRRIDETVDFYLNWTDYQKGFGDVKGSYWMGLDDLHEITYSASYQLRVDLEDWEGNAFYALYSEFYVGGESTNYQLYVSGYSGNAGDSLAHQNNRPFTTKDRDNDQSRGNCAINHHGGWWYYNCAHSNLNGEYLKNVLSRNSIFWYTWRNRQIGLKRSEMKIRLNRLNKW